MYRAPQALPRRMMMPAWLFQEDMLNLSPLPLAVFVADAHGAIMSWNRACEKLAGYSAAEMHGRTLDQLIEFEDAGGKPL